MSWKKNYGKCVLSDDSDDVEDSSSDCGLSLEKLNLGPRKKLIVLNLNGLLLHRVHRRRHRGLKPNNRRPDGTYGNFLVYKRPFSEEFLKFCFERFEVGIWSSAMEHNIDAALDRAVGSLFKRRLLFIWDQTQCTNSGFYSLEKRSKPLFFKELKKVWEKVKRGGPYSASNTQLIDDKPYKALLNPPNTGIFPEPYDPEDKNDAALNPEGELGSYLEGLAKADDVQSYVKEHPFAQPAISSSHPDWSFYSMVLNDLGKK